MAKAEKKQAQTLEELSEALNTKYGKGSVVDGKYKDTSLEVISTGSISFDQALSCGGVPIGKLIEILGMESAGKSTICLHMIAEFQKKGKNCMLMDFEHSWDKNYGQQIGVDTDKLWISQPEDMESGYNLIYDAIISGHIDLIILDSHTAMISKMRLDNDAAIGDAKVAPEARVNSDALRKINPALDKYKCTLVGVSQMRDQIGNMGGETKAGTGGNSWKFFPSIRIKVFKILDKVNELNKTTIEVIKNKCGNPFGKCTIPIAWGIGIDKNAELVDMGSDLGFVKKAGSWFTLPDIEKPFQGMEATTTFLGDNPEYTETLRNKILEAITV